LIDCSPSMDWGRPNKLLYAKRVAAALGAMALAGYDTVSLGAFSAQLTAVFPPLRGRSAVAVLLEHLTTLQAGSTTDLERSVAEYCGSVGRRGVAILLTDFLVPNGHAEALGYLARSGLYTTALHLIDRQEQHPDLTGLVDFETAKPTNLSKSPSRHIFCDVTTDSSRPGATTSPWPAEPVGRTMFKCPLTSRRRPSFCARCAAKGC
jgi:hypothetical protein